MDDEDERRSAVLAALGSIEDAGHDWDDDPGRWVRQQRSGDRMPPSAAADALSAETRELGLD